MRFTLALALPLAALALAPSSTRDGVYTDTQATRGQALYKTLCASCHGENLEGAGVTPALAGSDFTGKYEGQTVGDLFDRIQDSMPADHPGTLTRPNTADLVAYLLKTNKLPAGKTELPTDADALKQIRFDPAKQ